MIRILFAIAIGLFVLSLPIYMTALGAALRRAAGFCFILALIPSLVVGLFFPEGIQAHPFAVAAALAGLILLAYAVLRIRSAAALGQRSRSPRLMEKTPIDQTRRREQDFFAFIADRQRPPEDE